MSGWTFITKHAVALSIIAKHPRITGLELSAIMGITERAVRKIIADLYAAGYIKKKREGKRVRYRINPDESLRQETHRTISIGNLLEALGWKRSHKQPNRKNPIDS